MNVSVDMERKRYIDIAKGLLILMVIMHHLPQVGNRMCGLNSEFLDAIDSFSFVVCAFFMQAFFLITGFCSSFNKPFGQFVWANFKNIIWAGLTLGVLTSFIYPTLYLSFVYTIDIRKLLRTFAIYGTEYWFLSSLFTCKLLLYALLRLRLNKVGLLVFSVLLIFAGISLNNKVVGDSCNFWYFHHSCFMFFFLVLGYVLKEKEELINVLTKYSPLIYVSAIFALFLVSEEVPFVTHKINLFEYYQVPMYITLSTSGTFLVLWLSKRVNSNFLEYLGKNSLIVYCTHYSLLQAVECTISKHIISPNAVMSTAVFCVVTLIATLLLLIITIRLVNSTYFKWMLGK